jgi:hypothetical protein
MHSPGNDVCIPLPLALKKLLLAAGRYRYQNRGANNKDPVKKKMGKKAYFL